MSNEPVFDRPVVEPSQYLLMHVEVLTGYVLITTGERYVQRLIGKRYVGNGEQYMIFDSLADAERYAEAKVTQDPYVECFIVDYEGNTIKHIQGNLDLVIHKSKPPVKKKRWWFWSR